jgi:hypothetical protein
MKLICAVFVIMLAALFIMTACSPVINQGGNENQAKGLLVNVNADSEYRAGPGQMYEKIGVLAAGQVVEAFGRNPDGNYLLFQDPANPGKLYWLEDKNVTVTGNPGDLPVATPMATPTPISGCPTPIGGGPTAVDCGVAPSTGGCPTPIGGGPTEVNCGAAPSTGGCPTPIGGGPTEVNCGVAPLSGGCPTPIGGGPTAVDCNTAPSTSGCPTPIGGGPTPISCSNNGGSTPVPLLPLRRVPTPTSTLPFVRRVPTSTPVR